MRRDGADFGPAQGARREQWGPIVTDEQRSDGPKSARPFGVALGSLLEFVVTLARGQGPRFASLLPSKLPSTITVYLPPQDRV